MIKIIDEQEILERFEAEQEIRYDGLLSDICGGETSINAHGNWKALIHSCDDTDTEMFQPYGDIGSSGYLSDGIVTYNDEPFYAVRYIDMDGTFYYVMSDDYPESV